MKDVIIAMLLNPWTYVGLIVFWIVAFYLVYNFGRKTDCVILGKFDAAALITIGSLPINGGFLFFFFLCAYVYPMSHWPMIVLLILIWGVPFVAMVITSIVSNMGYGAKSFQYIAVSLIGKVAFISVSFIIGIFCRGSVYRGSSAPKDARYTDGTRDNKKTELRTAALKRYFKIFNPLFFDLIKPYQDRQTIIRGIYKKAKIDY